VPNDTALDLRHRPRRSGRSRPETGGVFEITCDGLTIWERKADRSVPDVKVLKATRARSPRSRPRPRPH
jgi:predicted Rdx family selenoprotein